MRNNGFSTFLTLSVLVLVTGAVLLALRAVTTSVVSARDQVLKRNLESRAINSLLHSLATSDSNSAIECYSSASPLFKRNACRISETPENKWKDLQVLGSSAGKLYDYESLFKDALTCAPSSYSIPFFPSPRSAISALGCGLSGTLRTQIARYGNITIPERIQLSTPVSYATQPLCIVAASGYIQSNAEIAANCDLLILAGGDLLLHSVSAGLSGDRNLTLHSATGTVEIGSITGFARVSIISSFTPNTPDLSGYLPSQIAVPLLDRQIIGIGLNSQNF